MTSKTQTTGEPKNRLWVISELYFPEETSTGYYLTRIAEGLVDRFDVKVISGQPNYSARGTVAPKQEEHRGVKIFRAGGTRLDKDVIVFRLINMLTLSCTVFVNALRRFKSGDRILVVTNPPTMPFVVALASLFRGASYTLLIHDNYPEILIAAKKIRSGSFPARTLSYFNRWLYKYAAKIIVVGRDMEELAARKTDGLDIPIVTIPNWAELESISPDDKKNNTLLIELGIADKFVFLYAGNMGPLNDLESIVDCAEKLAANTAIHFVFLGAGVKKQWLTDQVNTRSLVNVTVLEPRPRSEQQVFLNACDVAFVSLVDKMHGVSMPSRTYNILAAGKPMIALAQKNSELARIIDEERVGWIVSPGSPQDLLDTINNVIGRTDELEEMGKRARFAAETKYSLETALEKYRDAL
ncbi:MAG: glycosyltransferase family 4 protein [Pyrinomonadaceae bacterium]